MPDGSSSIAIGESAEVEEHLEDTNTLSYTQVSQQSYEERPTAQSRSRIRDLPCQLAQRYDWCLQLFQHPLRGTSCLSVRI
jgi:hypothetical protein